jgi:UDP-N-acetylglucosamine 1-carboxyvinyltransferase
MHVKTAPYPEYPTDLQPQIAPLMALGAGGTIKETVWQSRFSYLEALSRFGLDYEISGSLARIKPSALRAAHSYAPDLRGGAAAVASALSASGESVIENSEIIARGYARFVERLASLGADIKQIKEN